MKNGESYRGWFWYLTENYSKLDTDKCGKWMYFFTDQDFAKSICEKAIKEQVCYECKCADLSVQKTESDPICFYLNGDDVAQHKSVIQFMLDNDLIKRTKVGKLYNISFKYNSQTLANKYGEDFKGELKLENFIDLFTGEWIK